MFQFTHPGGVRLEVGRAARPEMSVSIHAPGRGATFIVPPFSILDTRFNSRTREGCDEEGIVVLVVGGIVSIHAPGRGATVSDVGLRERDVFQFTHPGGVRRSSTRQYPTQERFQFTHPGGVRHISHETLLGRATVSIHAPGRGATRR